MLKILKKLSTLYEIILDDIVLVKNGVNLSRFDLKSC